MRKPRTEDIRRATVRTVRVRTGSADRRRGWLFAGPLAIPVALGRSGVKANKREGDGATPRGRFRLRRLWWRNDRGSVPRTLLPIRRITPHDAWCEDPADRRYNQPLRLREHAAGDRLWRDDHLYDLIVELDHNVRPRIAGRGSAVFLHVARPGFGPTAGCIAVRRDVLRRLLGFFRQGTEIAINT
jgi:L,D-peptidoglycan transpeptidase YkuD (ErfK/YbiS/YcfS/YnhG family)